LRDTLDRLTSALSDRYALERELGSGGMATVYLAHDVKHGRKVAIKVLRPELASSLGPERFVREIEIAAKLTHPHILPLFDSGEAAGFLYYVMPYVEGESLRGRLDRTGKLPLHEAIQLTEQIASALQHAHERGVIHRDIKPENILLAGDQAIVADFGIARAVELAGGEKLTGTGLAVGTPAYMSPEQALGADEVDTTTDIYALGCMVYEMLAGRAPFQATTPQALLAKHAVDPVPSLRASDPKIPVPVERVVERALAKISVERFARATDFARALAGATTPAAQLAEARRVARRRWTRALAGVAAIAALVFGGWWLTGRAAAQPIERLAVLPASNMTRDPEQDYFVDGVHEALVTELQRAGIPIIARQSVLQYRDTEKPMGEIAQELGVDALIQPAVGREGDSVIVDVSLYGAHSRLPLWTQSFPAEVRGVLGVYREVSQRIASEIGIVLSARAEGRLAERPTVDPLAYEAVLKGQFHYRRYTPEDFATALRYFERALAIDSNYAPAHIGISQVWGARAVDQMATEEAARYAEQHLAKAAALDPESPTVRALKASKLVWLDWEIEAGEKAYRRALELDPNDAQTQVFYGHVLAILGRWQEAIHHGERAMELDPLNPFVAGLHGTLLHVAGHTDEAIELLQDMFERHPGIGFGRDILAYALYSVGRFEQALEYERTYFETLGDTAVVEALDHGLERGGHAVALTEAAGALAARADSTFVSATKVALLYAAAGKEEEAIDWLEIAVKQRDMNVPYMGAIPLFRKLHDQERFRSLAEEVGVPLVTPEGTRGARPQVTRRAVRPPQGDGLDGPVVKAARAALAAG
jgi:serine/threonine-protein kinase